jgi:NHLM bacteriocin system ABC transporter peptidase/ATP-binding protein
MNATSRRARAVSTPIILQMEAVECGAVAVAMVLAHHGRRVPLEELREDCGVSRDGSKASNLVRAAQKYGLAARGYKKEPIELQSMRPPMILHWNFNHFVVLNGFCRKGAVISDPAVGPRVVSLPELDQAFTGVVLTFEKSPDFRAGGRNPSFVPALRSRLRGAAFGVLFAVLSSLLLAVPRLVGPTFTTIFIDQVLIGGLHNWLSPLLMAMMVTAFVVVALTALQQRCLLLLENRLSMQGAWRFAWHVLRLPVRFFTQRSAGDIASRIATTDRIGRLLSDDLASTAVSALLVIFYAFLLFRYDVLLALVGVLTASLNVVALQVASRRRVHLTRRLVADRGKLIGGAMGALQTIDSLKASGAEGAFLAQWSGRQAKVVAGEQELATTTMILGAVPPLLLAMTTALTLAVGGLRIMDGQLSIGMLMAFQALLSGLLAPVGQMVDVGSVVQEVKSDMARLDDVLEARIDPAFEHQSASVSDRPPHRLSGSVELRDVTFGFSPLEEPLVKGFNLTLFPGSRVALVGGSGAGKSTIARLVAGLHAPWSGQILFDGEPRASVPREAILQSLAFVDQDIRLFEDTVTANLTLWDASVPESNLLAATRDACVHREILSRPGGYASKLDEGGANFSGGQRQRIEIARALAINPSIVIFDEATSALDPTTEKMVDENIRRRGCTCLIVAHRLSTIRDCDEILVMEAGQVVQRGTHDELIGLPGPYRTLILAEAA